MRMIAAFAMALAAILPASVAAHEGTEVAVVGEVRANGPIEITGEDFEPGDVVRIELRKEGIEPIELGDLPVEADGSFSATLHVPDTAPPGIYELAADGEESATTQVTVLAPAEGSVSGPEPEETREVSSDRPATETAGLAIATVLIAAAGLGLLVLSRTKPQRTSG